jgi:hypothetical protein
MTLMLAVFGIYVMYGVEEYTPSEYINMVWVYLGYLQFGICMLMFYYACTQAPGVITSKNITSLAKKYEYDNILYDKKDCSTCKFIKYLAIIVEYQEVSIAVFVIFV